MDEPERAPMPAPRPVPVAEASEPERETARFAALFMLGVVLFSPLLLTIFDRPDATVFGIPLLYFYLFSCWAILVALAAWLSQRIAEPPSQAGAAGTASPPPGGD